MKNIRKVVFPVAGFDTRFFPATRAIPKELLRKVDKPLIQYVVEEAIAASFDTLIFVTGLNKWSIEDHQCQGDVKVVANVYWPPTLMASGG